VKLRVANGRGAGAASATIAISTVVTGLTCYSSPLISL